jgi:hypothetical protein
VGNLRAAYAIAALHEVGIAVAAHHVGWIGGVSPSARPAACGRMNWRGPGTAPRLADTSVEGARSALGAISPAPAGILLRSRPSAVSHFPSVPRGPSAQPEPQRSERIRRRSRLDAPRNSSEPNRAFVYCSDVRGLLVKRTVRRPDARASTTVVSTRLRPRQPPSQRFFKPPPLPGRGVIALPRCWPLVLLGRAS